MKILTLVPGGIGDQVLFFPTLEDLHHNYPKASIDVLVEPRAKAVYKLCPYVHEVLTFDYKDRNGMADYLNLLGVIRDREYDISLSLGQRWTVGLLLWLNGIPSRVGYHTTSSWFISNPVPLKTEQYAAHMYHDLLQGLGLNIPCPDLKVTLSKEDITWAESQQKNLGIKDSGYILIHGGSSNLAKIKGIDKIYPYQKWQEVISGIRARLPEMPIVVLEGPEDTEFVGQITQVAPDVKVTTPSNLGRSAAMIAGANLLLCTDSAPMHLSVAVGTYTIALFGPTDAKKLLPPNNPKYVGIQSPTKSIGDIPSSTVLEQVWRA